MIFISRNKKLVYLVSIVVLCLIYFIVSAIAQTGINKNLDIVLEYKSGTENDADDNGIETIGNIIDFTVENSLFKWDVDASKLCTKWDVDSNSIETPLCYGGEECCSFIELTSTSANWDDSFYINYGRYDASYNNIVSAQVVYVNYSVSIEDPYEDIAYSNESTISADFEKRKVEYTTSVEEINLLPDNVSAGDIVDVHARLLDNNGDGFSKRNLNIYLDGEAIGVEETDNVGYILFKLDTSSLYSGEHSVKVKFLGSEVSLEEEIITYLPRSSSLESFFIQGSESSPALLQNANLSFQQVEDCKTEYWETREPIYGTCQIEHKINVCDDYPINKSCHEETKYYEYECKTGTETFQHSKEICTPSELRITRKNEEGRINFKDWGKCSTQEGNGALIVICDSMYDGNNDGICQSGESCEKFVISEQGVQRYLKNSQEYFTTEDESFFLEELDYEVLRNGISGTSSEVMSK
ncbi:MAG: hypothetical protein U9O94_10120 [Nanoarchaeota archaeon]|nr:hypothetical protein [Nanoarchaeota archaeon]